MNGVENRRGNPPVVALILAGANPPVVAPAVGRGSAPFGYAQDRQGHDPYG